MLKIVLIGLTLTSCCQVPTQARLSLPPDVVYPKIEASELQCLTDDVYKRLNIRRVMCEGRISTLKGIIRSTH